MVASALDYWAELNGVQGGTTSDAYLTTPVGVNTLNFGPHAFVDLSGYNNPDGINAILAWTANPVPDENNGLTASTPQTQFNSPNPLDYARVDIGNAIAAIEGTIAINYLIAHNVFPIIDANHNGLITAAEIQNFVDNSTKMGMPEAGAMARLLGGVAHPRDGRHRRGRIPRPARRPPAPLQLLRLRGRRPAQRRDLARPAQHARAHAAPHAGLLPDHLPAEGLGQRIPARPDGAAQLPALAAPPAPVRAGPGEPREEVQELLARHVQGREGGAPGLLPPALQPVRANAAAVGRLEPARDDGPGAGHPDDFESHDIGHVIQSHE